MNRKNNISWDDYLFQDRNREFGAYQIRKHASSNLTKSLLIVIFFLGTLVTGLSFTDKKEMPVPDPITEKSVIANPITVSQKEKKEKPQEMGNKKPSALTQKDLDENIMPEPAHNPDRETIINKNTDLGLTRTDDPDADTDNGSAYTGDGNTISTGDNGDGDGATEGSEENKIYNVREISDMALFPGCEKAGPGKKELQECMSAALERELNVQLEDFRQKAHEDGLTSARTRLYFIVDKSGRITNIRAHESGNDILGVEARKALNRIADRLYKRKKYIKPAKLDDGTPVNLNFTLPLYYNSN